MSGFTANVLLGSLCSFFPVSIMVIWLLIQLKQINWTLPVLARFEALVWVLAIFAPCMLFIILTSIPEFINDVHVHQNLKNNGEVQTVPVIDTMTGGMKYPAYDVIYEYNGRQRKQSVSKNLYEDAKRYQTVDILVYGDDSRLVGSEPNYNIVVAIMFFGTWGVLFSGFLPYAAMKYGIRSIRLILYDGLPDGTNTSKKKKRS